ncbi:MAG: glycosyltransferase family 2 protein [Actinomycetota bacterium]|nr:glycosyltransferase family 2 protein [Actinomycetota bacterium]
MTAPDVTVVLPAHNEVALLGSTVTNLCTGLDARGEDYEILVVENGSRDGTLRLARLLSAQIERVRVLALPVGNYGSALAAGFRSARGRYVVNFDVDYYDLAFLDSALALLRSGEAELVLASKRAPGASDRRPPVRRVLTYGFANLSKLLVGLGVTDAHGMKAVRREALAPVVARCVTAGSVFDVEMVVRSEQAGLRIREVPASVVERRSPRTPVARRSLESLVGLLSLRRALRRDPASRAPRSGRARAS